MTEYVVLVLLTVNCAHYAVGDFDRRYDFVEEKN